MSNQQVIGKFNKNLDKIQFYDVVDTFKHYIILRKQGTDKYYAWDNKEKMLSDDLHINNIPSEKKLYEYIIDNSYGWHLGEVMFYADSQFVTDYGLPHYDKLVEIYKHLLGVKKSDCEIKMELEKIRYTESYLVYLKCKIHTKRYLRKQRKIEKELEKEFKLIW